MMENGDLKLPSCVNNTNSPVDGFALEALQCRLDYAPRRDEDLIE